MVGEKKMKAVERVCELIEKYPTIGVFDLFKLPTCQFQRIRTILERENNTILIIKKSLIKIALRKVRKENVGRLEEFLSGESALIFSHMDGFKLYLRVSKLRFPRFGKEGDIAPKDILIKAGPTKLSAGPVIAEFSKAKIPAGIEKGVISIKKDVVVARKGEIISKEISSILKKLGIKCIDVGIDLLAVYSDGKIYGKETLKLVGEPTLKALKEAFTEALNLSIAIKYPTTYNISCLLAQAWRQAKFLEERIKGG